MRRPLAIALVALLVLIPSVHATAEPGEQEPEPTPVTPYVIGGIPAATGAWPGMVALVIETPQGLAQFCGGTLIRADLVLTAAHCTEPLAANPEDLLVLLGRTDLQTLGGELIAASAVIQHPNWNSASKQGDLALIRLSEPASQVPTRMVTPATEPDWRTAPNGTIVGWGRTDPNTSATDSQLRQLGLSILTDAQCLSLVVSYQPGVDLCGGGVNQSACFGDSGGPFMTPPTPTGPRVAGVISRGPSECGTRPGIFTRVAPYADWVFQTTQSPNTSRISGPDRYATAASLSAAWGPGTPVVYLVTGEQFPDAVTAAAIAGAAGGPVLLTQRNALPDITRDQLSRLGPQRLVVVGGPGAVSDAVVQAASAAAGVTAVRIAGPDRYATAASLASDAYPSGAATVFVTVGTAFPDAVASGPVAGGPLGGPVLLTETNVVPAATVDELARLKPTRVVILGGTSAVAESVRERIASLLPAATIQRVSGPDRYATSAALSAASFAPGVPVVYLATGRAFPDALASGPVAVTAGAPVLLIDGDTISPSVAAEIARLAPEQLVVLGGPVAISAEAAWLLDGLL